MARNGDLFGNAARKVPPAPPDAPAVASQKGGSPNYETIGELSWNAYTYVFNNPLRYTDPTGMLGVEERQWIAAGVAIVAAFMGQGYISAQMYTAAFATVAIGGFASGAIATQSFRGGVLGSMTAVVTAGVGSAVAGGGISGWAVQTFTGGVMGSLQGGGFGHSFASAGLTAAFMPQVGKIANDVGRTLVGAMVGGTVSELTGGKFANGAVTGAIMAAMAGGPSERSASGDRRGARQLSRRMTAAEKTGFEAEVGSAVAETRTQLFAASFVNSVYGSADAGQYTQAWDAMSAASVVFDLDNYGPNAAEMQMTTQFAPGLGRNSDVVSSRLNVYKGAYETYLYGSPAPRGYTLSFPSGHDGMLGLVAHESGHGVMVRNIGPTNRPLRQKESMADDWARQVWPGKFP